MNSDEDNANIFLVTSFSFFLFLRGDSKRRPGSNSCLRNLKGLASFGRIDSVKIGIYLRRNATFVRHSNPRIVSGCRTLLSLSSLLAFWTSGLVHSSLILINAPIGMSNRGIQFKLGKCYDLSNVSKKNLEGSSSWEASTAYLARLASIQFARQAIVWTFYLCKRSFVFGVLYFQSTHDGLF